MADSTIAQYLNKILEAVYGKDVRQAIYDSISQCYEDVNSPSLNTEALEKILQEKIESGDLAAMEIADNSITEKKYQDESVTYPKMQFIDKGKSRVLMTSADTEKNDEILIKLLTKPFIIVSKGTGDYPSVTLRIRDYPETYGTMYLTTSNNYLTVESETAFGLTTIDGYKYGARRYTITLNEGISSDEIISAYTAFWWAGTQFETAYLLEDCEVTEELIKNNFVEGDQIFSGFKELIYKIVGTEQAEVFEPDFSSLSGKYGLHIGDSYTKAMASTAADTGYSDGAFIALDKKMGLAGGLNYGIASSTIRDGSNSLGFSFNPIVSRVCHDGDSSYFVPLDREDIGYITLMGGTNDSAGIESSIGSDIYDGASCHIYGAMHQIMQTLLNAYPDVPFIVILQPCSANNENTENPEGTDISGLSQSLRSVLVSQRKQKVVKEVAELYARTYKNVHIVDCCFNWYSPLISSELQEVWSSDLLHLTTNGYEEITEGTKYDSVYKKMAEIFSTQEGENMNNRIFVRVGGVLLRIIINAMIKHHFSNRKVVL